METEARCVAVSLVASSGLQTEATKGHDHSDTSVVPDMLKEAT